MDKKISNKQMKGEKNTHIKKKTFKAFRVKCRLDELNKYWNK